MSKVLCCVHVSCYFSSFFSVFRIVIKHGLLWLIYYFFSNISTGVFSSWLDLEKTVYLFNFRFLMFSHTIELWNWTFGRALKVYHLYCVFVFSWWSWETFQFAAYWMSRVHAENWDLFQMILLCGSILYFEILVSLSLKTVGLIRPFRQDFGIWSALLLFWEYIAELLHTEGTQVEPHTLKNLATHRCKTFCLSHDCPYRHMFICQYLAK